MEFYRKCVLPSRKVRTISVKKTGRVDKFKNAPTISTLKKRGIDMHPSIETTSQQLNPVSADQQQAWIDLVESTTAHPVHKQWEALVEFHRIKEEGSNSTRDTKLVTAIANSHPQLKGLRKARSSAAEDIKRIKAEAKFSDAVDAFEKAKERTDRAKKLVELDQSFDAQLELVRAKREEIIAGAIMEGILRRIEPYIEKVNLYDSQIKPALKQIRRSAKKAAKMRPQAIHRAYTKETDETIQAPRTTKIREDNSSVPRPDFKIQTPLPPRDRKKWQGVTATAAAVATAALTLISGDSRPTNPGNEAYMTPDTASVTADTFSMLDSSPEEMPRATPESTVSPEVGEGRFPLSHVKMDANDPSFKALLKKYSHMPSFVSTFKRAAAKTMLEKKEGETTEARQVRVFKSFLQNCLTESERSSVGKNFKIKTFNGLLTMLSKAEDKAKKDGALVSTTLKGGRRDKLFRDIYSATAHPAPTVSPEHIDHYEYNYETSEKAFEPIEQKYRGAHTLVDTLTRALKDLKGEKVNRPEDGLDRLFEHATKIAEKLPKGSGTEAVLPGVKKRIQDNADHPIQNLLGQVKTKYKVPSKKAKTHHSGKKTGHLHDKQKEVNQYAAVPPQKKEDLQKKIPKKGFWSTLRDYFWS